MAKIKKIYKGGVEYEISGNEIDSVTVDYQEDGGSPDASAQYSDGELAFSLKNMKMKFSELTAAEKAEITGPQGPQGDSAIWTGEGEPWSGLKNTSGQSTTEPMTQKAVTDAFDAVTDMVTESETFSSSELTEQVCSLGVGVWFRDKNTGPQRHVAFPVEPGQIVKLTPSSQSTSVIFFGALTSSYSPPYKNQAPVPYITGTDRIRVVVGEESTYVVPEGCAYIALTTVDGGNNVVSWDVELLTSLKPHIAQIDEAINNFAYDEKMMVRIGTANPLQSYYINPSSPANWTNSTAYMCRIIPIDKYKGNKLVIVNTSGVSPMYYALLRLEKGSVVQVQYAEGTSIMSSSQDTTELTVPLGANYLYLYEYDNGTYLSHSVFAEESKSDFETRGDFTAVNQIDLSQISERPCSLGVGVFYRASNNTGPQKHKTIAVNEGECYRLLATGLSGQYGFFTSSYSPSTTYKNNNAAPYVEGTDRMISSNGVPTSIQIPAGCAYLAITTVDGAGISPTWKIEKGYVHSVTNYPPFKVRVASWNIGGFSLGTSGTSTMTHEQYPEMRQKWAEAINDINADIFCCCEYNVNMVNVEGSLPAIKARDAIFSLYPYAYEGSDYNYMCTAIMSNYAVNGVNEALYMNTVVPNRYYQYGYINVGNEIVVVAITHLDHNAHGPTAETVREQQMQELIGTFKDYPYVIICADWNVNSPTEFDRFANAGYKMANHGNIGDFKTAPAGDNPTQYLDNIVCKGFAVNGIKVVNDDTLSDHCAVYADFTLIR